MDWNTILPNLMPLERIERKLKPSIVDLVSQSQKVFEINNAANRAIGMTSKLHGIPSNLMSAGLSGKANRMSVLSLAAGLGDAVKRLAVPNTLSFPTRLYDKGFLSTFAKHENLLSAGLQLSNNSFKYLGSIFESSRQIADKLNALKTPFPYASKKGLEYSLGVLSSSISRHAAIYDNSNFLKSFNDANLKALELSNEGIGNLELDDFIEKIKSEFVVELQKISSQIAQDRRLDAKSLHIRVFEWITVISLILGLVSVDKAFNPPTDAKLYKKLLEVSDGISKVSGSSSQKAVDTVRVWATSRETKVFYNKGLNSQVVTKLSPMRKINVISICHKWAFISYVDPNDHMLKSGWVLKKYISVVK